MANSSHLSATELAGLDLATTAKLFKRRFAGQVQETKLLIGFCLAIRRDILNRIGLLDESMFLGSEDLEVSWRIRSHGLKLLMAIDVFVHHFCSVSMSWLPSSVKKELIDSSTNELRRKLAKAYANTGVPASKELWGCSFVQLDI